MGGQERKIKAFVKLGDFLGKFCEYHNTSKEPLPGEFLQLHEKIIEAGVKNSWFSYDNVFFSIRHWADQLEEGTLKLWLEPYHLREKKEKTVALIMAGNIPLVGFHDLLCVLLTGNNALVKMASDDQVLLPFLADKLVSYEPDLKGKIRFTKGKLADFDAVIATGSNNTARYFEYYFGSYPNIIRKNRHSAAVLSGGESAEQLRNLGEDIFRYYGLGCRSVSKLFVPENYNFDLFFEGIFPYKEIINEQKYANNYDYNKAVFLMSEYRILDNGFLMLKEDPGYGSPIGAVFYEYYQTEALLKERLNRDAEQLQCVVAQGLSEKEVPFGQTQRPSLKDYADGVDTVEFLLKT